MTKKIVMVIATILILCLTGCSQVIAPPPTLNIDFENIHSNVNILNNTNQTSLYVEGNIKVNNLTTGNNSGIALCVDINSKICVCGSCA